MVIFLLSCITGDDYLQIDRKSLVFDRHIIFYRTQLLYKVYKTVEKLIVCWSLIKPYSQLAMRVR